jgi:RNA polymerase sigma factor (sigma-70 family)
MKLHYMQLLQRKAWKGVEPIKHDQRQDLALINAYKNGNEEACIKLIENYLDVFNYILHNPTKPPYKKRLTRGKLNMNFQDYEDLFQEIVFQFIKLMNEYDPSQGIPFELFVKKMLHQRVYDQYFKEYIDRKEKETQMTPLQEKLLRAEELDILLHDETLPSEHLELYKALNRLSKLQRKIITMNITQDYSLAEIARELGLEYSFVRVNKHRALKKLQSILEPKESIKQ